MRVSQKLLDELSALLPGFVLENEYAIDEDGGGGPTGKIYYLVVRGPRNFNRQAVVEVVARWLVDHGVMVLKSPSTGEFFVDTVYGPAKLYAQNGFMWDQDPHETAIYADTQYPSGVKWVENGGYYARLFMGREERLIPFAP